MRQIANIPVPTEPFDPVEFEELKKEKDISSFHAWYVWDHPLGHMEEELAFLSQPTPRSGAFWNQVRADLLAPRSRYVWLVALLSSGLCLHQYLTGGSIFFGAFAVASSYLVMRLAGGFWSVYQTYRYGTFYRVSQTDPNHQNYEYRDTVCVACRLPGHETLNRALLMFEKGPLEYWVQKFEQIEFLVLARPSHAKFVPLILYGFRGITSQAEGDPIGIRVEELLVPTQVQAKGESEIAAATALLHSRAGSFSFFCAVTALLLVVIGCPFLIERGGFVSPPINEILCFFGAAILVVLSLLFSLIAFLQRKRRKIRGVIGLGLSVGVALFTVGLGYWVGFAAPKRVAATTPRPHTPLVSHKSVFTNAFLVGKKRLYAGTSFYGKLKSQPRPLLFTAKHVLGTSGGLKEDMNSEQMAARVRGGHFRSIWGEMGFGAQLSFAPILQKDAYSSLDVVAFQVSSRTLLEALPLSGRLPKAGDHVWLAARFRGVPERLHHAVVATSTRGVLYYYFTKLKRLRASSGGPIIDRGGRVVAINQAGLKSDGAQVGIGVSVHKILQHLQ